jgi:hypothetical protein
MSWWEKKLGPAQNAPRPSPLLPQGIGATVAPAYPPQPVYVPQGGAQPSAEELGYDPNTQIPAGAAIRNWRGDPMGGAKDSAVLGNCPACGSPRYLSRSSEAKMMANGTMANPMPECFECGYPRQQGSLGVGVRSMGAAKPSRQGAMMPLAIDKPQAQV